VRFKAARTTELRNSKIKYKKKEKNMGERKKVNGRKRVFVRVRVCMCVPAFLSVIGAGVVVEVCPGVAESPRPYSLMCNEEGEIVLEKRVRKGWGRNTKSGRGGRL
jgi:hypothetical protein